MLERLRSATQADHGALEDGLALLRAPLSHARFVQVLRGFHAFHSVWEPRVAGLIDDEPLLAPRRRLALLQRDLLALGAEPGAPVDFDLGFLRDESAAWGSLYVLEGSTLGGQVIAKALRRGAAWVPAQGLSYFNPHGRETAALWRGFCDALEAAAPRLDAEEVVRGARASFRVLHDGLARALEQVA